MTPTPAAIAESLSTISRDLDALVDEVARLDEAATLAKIDADVAEARAFLAAEGSVDARKAHAAITCEPLARDAAVKAAALRAGRERIRTLHARVEVGRSLLSLSKAEARL